MRSTNEAAKQEAPSRGVAAKVSREADGVGVGRELSRAVGGARMRSAGRGGRRIVFALEARSVRSIQARCLTSKIQTNKFAADRPATIGRTDSAPLAVDVSRSCPAGQLGRYHRRHPAMVRRWSLRVAEFPPRPRPLFALGPQSAKDPLAVTAATLLIARTVLSHGRP